MGLELPVWGAPTAAWIVATLGLVGASVLDRFLDDGGADDDDSGGMGGDDPFGGGGMGGGGMGGGMGGGGDDFDDFDGMDEWDDGFDDGDGGGSSTDELENRLDDLENEVASLSSTVSTVRSENEEISAAVDDIEEDVRNLLDIYEMVTRGINPFVDDSSGFDSVNGGGEGSFGLFDDDEEETESEDDLDEDVANADADGFFDDDLLDDDFEEDEDEDDGFDELDEGMDGEHTDDGDPADASSETAAADDGDDMNDDGKSFSELKEEYDAGEADWADEEGSDADVPADEDPFEGGDGSFDDTPGDETDPFENGDDSFDDNLGVDDGVDAFDEGMSTAGPAENGHEPDPQSGRGQRPGGDPAEASGDGFEYVREDDLSGTRGKPYLTELPGDYVGDLLVMEWLEFLVSESDVTDAVRAINYYERIEWVGPAAAARLRDFLSGFGTIDRNIVDRSGTDRLVREHHTRSLRYVTQLNGTSGHLLLLDRWDDLAGGSLVGGGAPAFGSRGGGRSDTRDRTDRNDRTDRRDRRANENGHGSDADRRDGRAEPRDERTETRDERTEPRDERTESRDGRADRRTERPEGRERNGGSPRPMNDPNPRSDRADPADGGWGDGR
ncbi:FlaD/FlaE family flagellar protein [Halorubrum trueperi]|uniref:FlaD/FlaE family flagellar protein n=1 Tax=Halorubrum trueperi TaxID=2004704 RepID=A0ABD5UQZ6_9EURY